MQPTTVKEFLTETHKVLAECGWIQNRWGDKKIGFCLDGAMAHVDLSLLPPDSNPEDLDSTNLYRESYKFLSDYLLNNPLAVGQYVQRANPVAWNDHSLQTEENVMSTLNKIVNPRTEEV